MSNVHGLYSNRNDESSDDSENENSRYVGGVSARGGGRWEKTMLHIKITCFSFGLFYAFQHPIPKSIPYTN